MTTCSLITAAAVAGVGMSFLAAFTPASAHPAQVAPAQTAPAASSPTPPNSPASKPGGVPIANPGAGIFQAEPGVTPKLKVSWPRKDGTTASYTVEQTYTAPEQRGPLAPNLTTYVALGGTRGEAGAADPRAAIVKVGFYKVSANVEFFQNIANDAAVTVELSNVKFNRVPNPEPQTGVQHGKYEDPNSVLGCTASQAVSTAMGGLDFYNTVDPKDDLAGKITPKNGRLGALAGRMAAKVEPDGTVTMTVTLPYAGLKHPDDPWLRTNPGDFAEPFHFHVEMEVLPLDAGARQPSTSPAKAQKPA